MSTGHGTASDFASRLAALLGHLAHVLPSQAPIADFVHHNTLHGFQHLPFDQALAAARAELGQTGFWPLARFRAEYADGRIDAADLEAVLDDIADINAVVIAGEPAITRRAVWRALLRHPCEAADPARLRWELAEGEALRRLPAAIAAETRRWRGGVTAAELGALWAAARAVAPPPSPPAAPANWADLAAGLGGKPGSELDELRLTRRELILALAGEDILDQVRLELIRLGSAHLDLGLAAWHHPVRQAGFYAAWRLSAQDDPHWRLDTRYETKARLATLPEDPVAAMAAEFTRLGLDERHWPAYLERLALQLPGWSGMFLWRHQHPGYGGDTTPVSMTDYLAVRLLLEGLAADAVARRIWGVPAELPALAAYFTADADHDAHRIELRLRLACHRGELPEALASRVQQMEAPGERAAESRAAWAEMADEARALAAESDAAASGAEAALGDAWRLFRLAQALDMDAAALTALGTEGAATILAEADALDENRAAYLWLQAYERHYAEQIFAALTANHGRALPRPGAQVSAQLVLCMDDREEGFRRHLEELDTSLQTLGGAAHFGVFQNYRGLGDAHVTPLCPVVPVVIKPSHEVHEVPRDDAEAAAADWQRQRAAATESRDAALNGTRFGLLGAWLRSFWQAPAALAGLLRHSLLAGPHASFETPAAPPTRLALTAAAELAATPATPEAPRLGFTDDEQAERIGNFLAALGLTRDFAPLVAIIGHGSYSQNNPHLAAYDCGACAGRHSGANARLFAAMANRPPVRELLAARGIHIPAATHFLGAEHNTCDDSLTWYDTEDIPLPLADAFERLHETLRQASAEHAVERCRRLMSAPLGLDAAAAWRHVIGRRHDYAQARPELGHVTNAAAFIGRRQLSRGVFFDRRAFLISYDPTQDADGAILTRHLTINGPVGAGISLEYYFSSVNNEGYGCGTKTMHNLVGRFGVMAGAASDLRTGLPRQMIEIHEPMRLLVVVENTLDMLTRIYQAQPALQELVGKGWLLLAAIEPVENAADAAVIHRFDPQRGWRRWTAPGDSAGAGLPEVECSKDWFSGHREALPPALLRRPLQLDSHGSGGGHREDVVLADNIVSLAMP